MKRSTKAVGLMAFVAAATALLYNPVKHLLSDISNRRRPKAIKKADEMMGKFANHYLGSQRHHSRKLSRRKPENA